MTKDADDEVIRELDRRLGGLSEPERDYIRDSALMDDAQQFGIDPELLGEIRLRRAAFGGGTARTTRAPRAASRAPKDSGSEAHTEAISAIFARMAQIAPVGVGVFRAEVLQESLLDADDVEEWVLALASKEGEPSIYLTVAVSASTIRSSAAQGSLRVPWKRNAIVSDEVRRQYLTYRARVNGRPCRVAVRSGGVLDRLRRLSENLANAYCWEAADATGFLLTGITPRVSRLSVTARGVVDEALQTSANTRLVITVDPTVSPDEVAEAYAGKRRSWLRTERHRPLSRKHLRLAVFKGNRPTGETAAECLAAWNKQALEPDRYKPTQVSNFIRDANKAMDRLLVPVLSPLERQIRRHYLGEGEGAVNDETD